MRVSFCILEIYFRFPLGAGTVYNKQTNFNTLIAQSAFLVKDDSIIKNYGRTHAFFSMGKNMVAKCWYRALILRQ